MTASTDRVRVSIAFHGGRGHTARLAEAVRAGAGQVPYAEVTEVQVDRITGPQWHQLDDADAIVFGAPTYMGTASGAFHTFAEASGKRWFTRKWQDKLAAGFTNSGSMAGDKSGTLGYFATLAAQHGMTWVNLGLAPGWNSATGSESDLNRLGFFQGAAAQSNVDDRSGTVRASDLATAEHLGRRVAELTRIVVAGRRALQP
ncbi:flavodoxin family protein [Streptomyces sp. B1866]|uniref:flavodoxin family protein n=1 Tax=Streptomyces sp. B1866 TaxID=3075431 RepID=UPI00288DE42F|nr:flavodoxin family protein [Streptomyces sp. B1866]MDT3396389.1 flavodoxin family protein [Streptomyces sp. B1866]